MPIRRRTAIVLGAALLAVGVAWSPNAAAAGTGGPAEPDAAAEYTIGQFNMAGGNAEHGPKGNEAPDALVRSVNDRLPAFMTLEETCRDWNDRLQSQLPDYTVAFHPVTGGGGEIA